MSKRIGVIDKTGALLSVAWALKEDGHAIRYAIEAQDEAAKEKEVIGKGLVDSTSIRQISSWKPDVVLVKDSSPSIGDAPVINTSIQPTRVIAKELGVGRVEDYEDGIWLRVTGWFHHKVGWYKPILSSFCYENLMPGDVGPEIYMGSIWWAWDSKEPLIFRQTLKNLTPWLEKVRYIGPISGDFLIQYRDRRPYFIDFITCLDQNMAPPFLNLCIDIGDWLPDFVQGKDRDLVALRNRYSTGVRIYSRYDQKQPKINAPLFHDRSLYPRSLRAEDDTLFPVKTKNEVLNFTPLLDIVASDSTIRETIGGIYDDSMSQISIDNLIYRNDIGVQAQEDLKLLNSWGYTTHDRADRIS